MKILITLLVLIPGFALSQTFYPDGIGGYQARTESGERITLRRNDIGNIEEFSSDTGRRRTYRENDIGDYQSLDRRTLRQDDIGNYESTNW